MPDQDSRKVILERILDSAVFRNKELYQKLLKYLVEASISGMTPKEVTVANDVFHKGSDFNASDDASVRVHMHNLRNKLDQYYKTEGLGDELKLQIPKGHYRVRFVKAEPSKSAPKRRANEKVIIILSLALLFLLLYNIADIWFFPESPTFDLTPKNNRLWSHFFNNDYPTSIVIGDFMVFHEYNDALDRSRRIQDYEINTVAELDTYIQKYPRNYPELWDLGELPHNIIYNMVDIYPIFYAFKRKPDISFTTEIDIDYIKNRNIIYIGEFKNLRVLSDLVETLPFQFETLPWWHGTLTYQQGDSLVTLNTSRDWTVSRYVVDLGIIANLPGHNAENYIIFAGFGYDSQIKIVDLTSHQKSLQELEDQIITMNGYFPQYFAMIFEIKGFDRASTTSELKYFTPLDKETYLSGLTRQN